MKVNLGVNLCYAAKRWPEPAQWGEQVGRRWGLKCVQFSFDLMDPRAAAPARQRMCAEVRKAAETYGFTVRSAFIGGGAYAYNLLAHPFAEFREDAASWCELAAAASEQLGAVAVGGPVAALSMADLNDPARREAVTERLVEGMRGFARAGARHGQEYVLWEPTPIARELSVDIDETKRLLERMNRGVPIPVKLCLDVGHQCAGGGMSGANLDTYLWLRELGAYAPVIHLQQSDGIMDRHWPMTKAYNERGLVRMDRVLEALHRSGAREADLYPEIIFAFEYDEESILREMDETIETVKMYVK